MLLNYIEEGSCDCLPLLRRRFQDHGSHLRLRFLRQTSNRRPKHSTLQNTFPYESINTFSKERNRNSMDFERRQCLRNRIELPPTNNEGFADVELREDDSGRNLGWTELNQHGRSWVQTSIVGRLNRAWAYATVETSPFSYWAWVMILAASFLCVLFFKWGVLHYTATPYTISMNIVLKKN